MQRQEEESIKGLRKQRVCYNNKRRAKNIVIMYGSMYPCLKVLKMKMRVSDPNLITSFPIISVCWLYVYIGTYLPNKIEKRVNESVLLHLSGWMHRWSGKSWWYGSSNRIWLVLPIYFLPNFISFYYIFNPSPLLRFARFYFYFLVERINSWSFTHFSQKTLVCPETWFPPVRFQVCFASKLCNVYILYVEESHSQQHKNFFPPWQQEFPIQSMSSNNKVLIHLIARMAQSR